MSTETERVLAGLGADERALAMERYTILRAHLDQGVPLAHLADHHQVTRQTLQRWLNAYRAHGLIGLNNKPRADRGQRRLPPPVLDLVRTVALQSPHASVAAIHRAVTEAAHQHELSVPSYASVHGVVQDLAIARNILALDHIVSTEGTSALSTAAQVPNALWIAVHHTLAVRVPTDSGSPLCPTLTVILDACTHAIVGFNLSTGTPSAQLTALALHHAIWPKSASDWPMCGFPQALAVDYGEHDIHSHLTQFCADRGITMRAALPFASQGSGKGEWFFRLLTEHWLDEYTATTPEPLLELETLKTHITLCCTWYHHIRHPATGQFPAVHWQQELPQPTLPHAIEDLDALLPVALRRVHQDGIYLHGQQYFAPVLVDYLSSTVTVRWNPDDCQTVRIYAEGRLLGVATRWEGQPGADALPALADYRQRLANHAQALRASLPAPMEPGRARFRDGFVLTKAFQQFADLCTRCDESGSIVLCCGSAGVGKTSAALAYLERHRNLPTDQRSEASAVVYLRKMDRSKQRAQSLDYLLLQAMTPGTRLVLIDDGEHLTEQDLHYLAELWQQWSWGLVIIGLPALLVRGMEQIAFAKHVTTCHLYQPLTDTEVEQWIRDWYTHRPDTTSLPSGTGNELSADVRTTIIKLTQGLPHALTRLLTVLEGEFQNNPRLTLSHETIIRAIERIEAPGKRRHTG
jgi:putative transposase